MKTKRIKFEKTLLIKWSNTFLERLEDRKLLLKATDKIIPL